MAKKSPELQQYWNFHEQTTVGDGLILKNTKIAIPDSLLQEILKKIHEGHIGTKKYITHV